MTDVPDEIGTFLNVQRAPPCRDDCHYMLVDRNWIPDALFRKFKKKESIEVLDVKLIVQVSPSSIARCRACGRAIDKKDLRIGYPVSDSRGDYGVLTAYVHTACCRTVLRYLAEIAISSDELDTHSAIWASESEAQKENEPMKPSATEDSMTHDVNGTSSQGIVVDTDVNNTQSHEAKVLENEPAAAHIANLAMPQEAPDETQIPKANAKPKRRSKKGSQANRECNDATDRESAEVSKSKSEDTDELTQAQKDVNAAVSSLTAAKTSSLKLISCLFHNWELLNIQTQLQLTAFALNIGAEADKKDGEVFLAKIVEKPPAERMATPPEMTRLLLPFQEEGLAWMFKQEESEYKGGILADEMGMGKTIQMIALLLARKCNPGKSHEEPEAKEHELKEQETEGQEQKEEEIKQKKEVLSTSTSKSTSLESVESGPLGDFDPKGFGGTLVVAPLAAVLQWKDEIERFTKPGSLGVLLYHGSCRDALLSQIHLYDVVITTYATIESDYRRIVNMHKLSCKYCGRMFLPEKLTFHQRYFCGPAATRTARQAKTEKNQKQAAKKAMKTLDIGKDDDDTFLPSISHVYKSILKEANIKSDPSSERVPWLPHNIKLSNEQQISYTDKNDEIDNKEVKIEDAQNSTKPDRSANQQGDTTHNKNENTEFQNCSKKRARPTTLKSKIVSSKKPRRRSSKSDNNLGEDFPEVYIEALCQMIEMGFSDIESKSALISCNGSVEDAIQKLTQEVEIMKDTTSSPPTARKNSGDAASTNDTAFDILAKEAANGKPKSFNRSRRNSVSDNSLSKSKEGSSSQNEKVVELEEGVPGKDGEREENVDTAIKDEFDERLAKAISLRQKLQISKTEIQKKKVSELQQLLKSIGAKSFGTKPELVNRLTLLLYPEEWGVPVEKSTDTESTEHSDESAVKKKSAATVKKKLKNAENSFGDKSASTVATKGKPSKSKSSAKKSINKDSQQKPEQNSVHDNETVSPQIHSSERYPLRPRQPRNYKGSFSPNTLKSDPIKNKEKKQANTRQRLGATPPTKEGEKNVARTQSDRSALSDSDTSETEDDDLDAGEVISESDESYSVIEEESRTEETISNIIDEPSSEEGTLSTEESISDIDDEILPPLTAPRYRKKKMPSSKKKSSKQQRRMPFAITKSLEEGGGRYDASKKSSSDEGDGVEVKLSPLHSILWNRIVLDEAHRIKSRTTSTAKAVYALKSSEAKWCLSGTPLQNRVGELYSLIRFLRINPFAYYFCMKKDCVCKSLYYRFEDNKFCVKCQHPRLSHYSYFNRKIITPIKNYGYQYEGKEGFRVLKEEVLDRILLRRTKLERAKDVNLPSLTITIRKDQLLPAERDFYESLYKQTKTEFETYVDRGTLLHNYAHIFDLLSRLRQAVAHPYLIIHGNIAVKTKTVIPGPSIGDSDICCLCQDDINEADLVISGCKHCFHRFCIEEYINSAPVDELGVEKNEQQNGVGCPQCYTLLTVDLGFNKSPQEDYDEDRSDISSLLNDKKSETKTNKLNGNNIRQRTGIMSRIKTSDFKPSTKMEALIQELNNIKMNDPNSKSIIFSQYTSMLELLEWRLKKGNLNCAKLVGSLNLTARSNILYAFNTDPNLKIILISLKAGGEGLNLQVANNIFLMDPWWNPAVELQVRKLKKKNNVLKAIQRAHRIGQTKPVRAIRFICENTIEEKMLQLQEKKQLVFDGTIGASNAAMAKLTADDLRFLFQN